MRIRFDRGTLVLDRVEPGLAPGILDGASWDSELCAWRMPASSLSELRVRLADNHVRATDTIAPAPLAAPLAHPPLRWYQQAAVDAWRAAHHRGVIALPTGAGKTLAALAAISALRTSTLVLVPTRILLDQWARTLEAYAPTAIGRLGDNTHRVEPLTVATYASAITWAPRVGDRFGLVVVDEAHHVGAWCPHEILEMLVAPARLGLTATPPAAATALTTHVGPTVYSISIPELAGDALAPFDAITIPLALAPDERAAYRTHRAIFAAAYGEHQRRHPDATWRDFTSTAYRTARGRAALAAWRASRAVLAYPAAKRAALRDLLAQHAADRILIFTADNATAYAIARELLVVPITGDIKRAERDRMLARFRSGAAPVLVSSQVLDEGLDVPEADIAIIVGGSGSERRHVQRIGRVLRPRPNKRAVIYELAITSSSELDQLARRNRPLRSEAPDAFPDAPPPDAFPSSRPPDAFPDAMPPAAFVNSPPPDAPLLDNPHAESAP
ncbi:MAG TPA: DEAD/DEAH box helicase family protein [Kofleriaceae bacterium]|nr:DEAD/DEAH box helicase family protein [Kofleriaceae bacterium]